MLVFLLSIQSRPLNMYLRTPLILLLAITWSSWSYAQHTVTIHHTNYDNIFDTVLCSEIEGFYVQTAEHATESIAKKIKRGSFIKDPDQPSPCKLKYPASYSNYNKQFDKTDLQHRLDKGHINPYSAFQYDESAATESMYYSNVCPQVSYFNEHQWEQVEQYVLKTVSMQFGDVKVWTGVLISVSHPKKAGDLYIPDFYWKVIQYKKGGADTQEAWLGPNNPDNASTKPADIVTSVPNLKRVITQYYPKFKFDF
jgi:DNA/RNA endonuclease G (NUC1)